MPAIPRMITGIALWAAIMFVSPAIWANAQELPFVHYTPESDRNPLPSAEVYKVIQSRTGYIWMAVFTSGLVRYDGRSYQIYDLDDGLRDLAIWNIVEDGLGRLWVASAGGLVVSEEPLEAYTSGRRVQFTDSIGGVPLLDVSLNRNSVEVDDTGALWAGTLGSGIVRYQFNSLDHVEADTLSTALDDEPEDRTVRAILARSDGSVWVSVGQGEVLIYDEASATNYERIRPDPSWPDAHINVLYEDLDGRLWAGSSDGRLLRLNRESGDFGFVPVDESIGGYVVSIVASRDSVLWVGSEGVGLVRFHLPSMTKLSSIAIENGLLSLNLHHILQDREGNLWFAQSGGVSKLRYNYPAFEYLTGKRYPTRDPVLPSKTVNAVIEGADPRDECRLWVGTLEGGIACIHRDYSSVYLDEEIGLRSNEADAMTLDRSGRLWVGTAYGMNGISFSSSMRSLPPAGEVKTLRIAGEEARMSGYRGTSIYSIRDKPILDREDGAFSVESIWFAGYRSVYGLIDNSWYVFRATSGLPATGYYAVEVDAGGRLWVGTLDEGLYRSIEPLSLDALKQLTLEEVPFQLGGRRGVFGHEVRSVVFEEVWSEAKGAPTNKINSLLWHDGVMWIGTPRGIFALQGTTLEVTTHLTGRDGLRAENTISLVMSPVTESIWAGTNGGLAEIDPVRRSVIRTVTKQDGLLDNEAWFYGSVNVGREGDVYYGSPNGLTIYKPHLDRQSNVEPLMAINHVTYAEDDAGNNDINIEYAGLSFANEGMVTFKTRLLGYDRDWSAEKTDNKIRYTNLPAYWRSRSYTFELLASNGNGVWASTPLRYSFVVRPALWLRWWAFVGYALALGAGAFMIDRYQRKRLIMRERERVEIEKERLRAEAAELQAKVLQSDYERQKMELEKARELEAAYHDLKAAQARLVQAEKMASMGQLTAGIAHEIKNPLNFVNNFADVSADYVEELRAYILEHGDQPLGQAQDELEDFLHTLQFNAEKIRHYGDRANAIIQSMLEHSRTTPGERRLVDVNKFLEEYVTHAYHSLLADDPDFEITVEREYDREAGEIELNTQDMSRTFFNILSNAFYAVRQKKAASNVSFQPRVCVKTKNLGDCLEIRFEDNGPGIPEALLHTIFEPFFTTKPAGSGTGLGLSLSYEIVTQGHGGHLSVASEAGEGATFIVSLPYPRAG